MGSLEGGHARVATLSQNPSATVPLTDDDVDVFRRCEHVLVVRRPNALSRDGEHVSDEARWVNCVIAAKATHDGVRCSR